MELTKAGESGTLWYTKKFLVFYYYVFLTNKIETAEYKKEIIDIFDNYITSLPKIVQKTAREFFYPSEEHECANLKSDKFRYFSDFFGRYIFNDEREKKAHTETAKKYYFAFLMGSGGQSGINAEIKRNLYKPDFDISMLDEIIINYSKAASLRLSGVKNDYHAFLRNERQVLYFLGYFHSKTSGAKDKEFSSLTPVGELALKANCDEFLALWEHQKIKMISQPPTIKIENVSVDFPERFAISFKPYHDILAWLDDKTDIKKEEYQYILSRNNNRFTDEEWHSVCNDAQETKKFESLKNKVKSFGRRRDMDTEDFNKELSKYLLGIRSDLEKDMGKNYFGICCDIKRAGKYELTNDEKLQDIIKIYAVIEKYKIQKYETLFKRCEEEIRRQYVSKVHGTEYKIDARVKIDWDIYNIIPDKLIILGVIVAQICTIRGAAPTRENTIKNADKIIDMFPDLLKGIGLNTKAKLLNEIKSLYDAIENKGDFSDYLMSDEGGNFYSYNIAAKHRETSSEDLFAKIVEASEKYADYSIERKRSHSLVSMIKSYYISRFTDDGQVALTCEACKEDAFMTRDGEPYLEFHHLMPFKICNGPDHFLNLLGLCANCHRKIHFGSAEIKGGLYSGIDANNYLELTIFQRLKELRTENILKSYHLEYLLAEGAITDAEYEKIAA